MLSFLTSLLVSCVTVPTDKSITEPVKLGVYFDSRVSYQTAKQVCADIEAEVPNITVIWLSTVDAGWSNINEMLRFCKGLPKGNADKVLMLDAFPSALMPVIVLFSPLGAQQGDYAVSHPWSFVAIHEVEHLIGHKHLL